MKSFPCTSCGACCKSIKGIDFLKEHDSGDGCCKYLDENNLCSIYEERPLLCNIDRAYAMIFSANYSKEEFYSINAEACNKLQSSLCIDNSFRVILMDHKA